MHKPVMQNKAKSEKKTITVAVYGNIVWKFIPLSIQNRLFASFKLGYRFVSALNFNSIVKTTFKWMNSFEIIKIQQDQALLRIKRKNRRKNIFSFGIFNDVQ